MSKRINMMIGDVDELRERLCKIMEKDPQSIREYTRRIFPINSLGGPNKKGGGIVVRKFLDGKGRFANLTLLKIKRFVDNYEK